MVALELLVWVDLVIALTLWEEICEISVLWRFFAGEACTTLLCFSEGGAAGGAFFVALDAGFAGPFVTEGGAAGGLCLAAVGAAGGVVLVGDTVGLLSFT